MKKTVSLLILLCMSVSVFAQYMPSPYPVPTLVEASVYAPVVEKQEPMRLTPNVMYPVAYVPMVDKQSCFRRCSDIYNDCVRVTRDFAGCRSAFYFPCIERCPYGEYPGPEIAFPADTRSACAGQCQSSYEYCIGAGGSVDVCSRDVLNPCRQRCNVQYPVQQPVREMPAGLSCEGQCEFKFQPCYASGSSGCRAAEDACIASCPGREPQGVARPVYQVPPPQPAVPQPVIYSYREVPQSSWWQRAIGFLFG